LSVDTELFRVAMSKLPTGVTVVTTRGHDRHELMTASAVLSVSLEPALLLVSVAETARWLPTVLRHGRFAVNFLSNEHENLALWCADPARHERPDLVPDYDVALSDEGLLLLPDALAAIECKVVDDHAAGDHRLVIGEVERLHVTGSVAKPLVFFDRAFTTTAGRPARLREIVAS